MTQKRDVR